MPRWIESESHWVRGLCSGITVRDLADARRFVERTANPAFWAGAMMVEAESWADYQAGLCTRTPVAPAREVA